VAEKPNLDEHRPSATNFANWHEERAKISEIRAIRGRKTHPGGVSPISHELARRKGKKLVKLVKFVAEKPTLGEYRPSVTNWHEERARN
jgi:hypothetical protein